MCIRDSAGIALSIVNSREIQISDIDLSRPTAIGGTGINCLNADNISITNSVIRNRRGGVFYSGGSDAKIINNDFTNTGLNSNEAAIRLDGIIGANIAQGVDIGNNVFGGPSANSGLRIDNMDNLIISDGSLPGSHIVLADGTFNDFRNDIVIRLINCNNTLIESIDMSRPTGTNGTGLNAQNCNDCLLYTSPSPRDRTRSRMPSSA